jgi:hypothetical protein
MSLFQAVWTDIPALVRDTLALIATAPTEALRLALLASKIRRPAR